MIENIGWLLIHSLWQFALWGLIAIVLLRCLHRVSSSSRYTVLVGILMMMTLTPVVTWWLLPDVPQVVAEAAVARGPVITGDIPPAGDPRSEPDPFYDPKRLPNLTTEIEWEDGTGESGRTRIEYHDGHTGSHYSEPEGMTSWSMTIHQALEPWLDGIVVCWFAGMLLFSLRPLSGWYSMRRLSRRGLSAVSEEILTLLRDTSERLGVRQVVSIFQSSLVKVPLVTGFLRPLILLPTSVVTGLPPAQLQAILAHELAHIRRYDQLVNLWQTLMETVFFYHPLVWWLSHQIRCERENCCDDLAVSLTGGKVEYSRALLAVEDLRGTSSALVLSSHGGSLSARIRRLVTGEPNDYRPGLLGVVAFVMLLASCTTAFLLWNADSPTVTSLEADSTPLTEAPMSLQEQAAWDALGELDLSISGKASQRQHLRRHLKSLESSNFPEEHLQKLRAEANRPIHSADFWNVPEEVWLHIVRLQSLRKMSFVATDLRGKPMELIGQMQNLQHLDLTNGECFPADLVHLKNLPELESVEIMLSVFGKKQDEWFEQRGELTTEEQQRLEELVSQVPPERQSNYRDVVVTALFTDRAIRELSDLENLRSFKLINTYVTGASIQYLSQLPKLEEIELSVVGFTREDARALGQVSTLRRFSQANANNEILQELSTLSNLEELEVWADGVTSAGIPHLLKLKNLRRLELRGNRLDDAGLIQLAELPKLEYLDVQFPEGPLSLAGVVAFQEKKPECKLRVDADLPLLPGGETTFVPEEEEEIIPPRPRDPADIDAPLPLQVSRKNPPDWAVPCDEDTPWLKQLPAYMPDNSFITVGEDSTQLDVLNAQDGSTIRTLPTGGRTLDSLRISDDRSRVACISRPLFDPTDPTRVDFSARVEVRKLPSLELVGKPIESEIIWNETLAISADGKFVAFSNAKNPNGVSVWEVESGKQVKEFPDGIDDSIHTMAFSPNGRWLVISSLGNLIFWEWKTDKPPQTIGAGRHTLALAFSPDSRYLFEGPDFRRTLQIRDMQTMKVVRRLKDDTGHEMSVYNMQFTDGGKTLIAGNQTGFNWQKLIVNDRLHFWDIETGKILRKFDFTRHEVYSVAVSPDGRYLIAVLWDLDEALLAGWDLQKLDTDKPD